MDESLADGGIDVFSLINCLNGKTNFILMGSRSLDKMKFFIFNKEKALTSDKKLGFISCFGIVCFDLANNKFQWIKHFPTRLKISLDEKNKEIIAISEDIGKQHQKIIIDFHGNIKQTKNRPMDKFIKKKFGNPILEKRQKIIALWNYNSFYLGDAQKDLTENDTIENFNKYVHRKTFDIESYSRSPSIKEINDKKIIEKYLNKEFHDEIIKTYNMTESIFVPSQNIARKILGKNKYNEMKNEFISKTKGGSEIHGIGNALLYYTGRFLAEYIVSDINIYTNRV